MGPAVLILCAMICHAAWGYPSGAPPTACEALAPNHRGNLAQNSISPYTITAETSGENYFVRIEAPPGEAFEGFILQGRSADNPSQTLHGQFIPTNLSQTLDCSSSSNTLTHTSKEKKSMLRTQWIPPPGFKGRVVFKGCVLQSFRVFWTEVAAQPIQVASSQTAVVPVATPKPTSQTQMYIGCGQTKSCFGMPSSCMENEDCEVLLIYSTVGNTVEYEMTGALGSNRGYIAMGLSFDNLMGNTSVTECLAHQGVIVRSSWNMPGVKQNILVSEEKSNNLISSESGEYDNGIITCKWRRNFRTEVEGTTFDMGKQQFYILLAKGPITGEGVKGRHSVRLASTGAVNMTIASYIRGESNILVKVHGSLMTLTWVGLVSIGILMARHYKRVWENSTLCGTKVWFAWHRGMMLLGVSLTIAAFIIIFINIGGWSQVGSNPHPVLGCICVGLGVIQPIMALFRPSPNAPRRPIFNWLHWLVGNAAQIFGIVTMFFAVGLQKASLPDGFYWVLITYVAFHCVVHFVMQLHAWMMENKKTNEIGMKEMGTANGDTGMAKDAPGGGFRKFFLGIFIFVNLALVIALILIICLQ